MRRKSAGNTELDKEKSSEKIDGAMNTNGRVGNFGVYD